MAESVSTKRKHTTLTIETKIEILNRLEKGESAASLARFYGVGKSTITDIKSKRESILNYMTKLDSDDGSKSRKTLKTSQNTTLEDAVFLWFTQRRSLGEPISGPLICEKALQLNKKLNGPVDFKASTGWLKNFKTRHGIRELQIEGEILSGDSAASEAFKTKFQELVISQNYSRDDVYNADETGVNWRALPSKSLASRREKKAPGYKVSKDRITAMVCSNASGRHSLPLLVIGKSKKPRCFKNIVCLPVIYRGQKSAWMDSEIFLEWFSKTFIPEVKKFREKEGKVGKVLLLIDNAPTHPGVDRLNAIDEDFVVMFFPPNVTALLQPMDQGIIVKCKKLYRKQVLQRLLIAERDEDSVITFSKQLNLKYCCHMLADSWDSLTKENLENGWNKLWKDGDKENESVQVENLSTDIVTTCQTIPGFEECDEQDVNEWLDIDQKLQGHQIYEDDEIVDVVANNCDDNAEDSSDDDSDVAPGPSHSNAFHSLETAMKWFEIQPESTSASLLALKRIRDLAAAKRVATAVQKKISDYFRASNY